MRHFLRSFALLAVLSAGLVPPALAETRPAVLELFTSEGCSSCPPAELLVNELARRPGVLALSYHVDYWDGLGWRDRFSFAGATARQRRYGQALHLASVYTPQALVDGTRDVVGSQRGALIQALDGPREGVPTTVSIDAGTVRVHVGAGPAAVPADVLLAGYLRETTTHIGRGENSGRTIAESNVVRTLQVLGSWKGEPRDFEFDRARLSEDVTDVAVLIQVVGQGAVLGAVSHAIR